MAATNLTLHYYPHTRAARGGRLHRMAAPLPRVSNGGKTYTFAIKQGFKFNDGQARDRCELQAGVRPGREPGDAVAGLVVPRRRRELQGEAARRSRSP